MMDKLWQDVRYALRLWARRPGVALVAIFTLALGIGANTAMFSIVNAVLLRPLPFANADRLVAVWGRTQANPRTLISLNEYRGVCRRDRHVRCGRPLARTEREPDRRVGAAAHRRQLRVRHVLRRPSTQSRARALLSRKRTSRWGRRQPVVVISHAFWETHFHSDPSAIGATLTLNGAPLTVIGIMAPPFDLKRVPSDGYFVNYDVYLPVGLFPVPPNVPKAALYAQPSMLSIARLKSGVSAATANANLDVVMQRLDAANPAGRTGRSSLIVSAQDDIVGNSRTSLLLLLASVGVVLLIACVNVSNLLVARAVDRQKEMALRAALGAGRLAVFRQLSVEAALLSVVASLAGLGLGRWALQALQTLPPPSVPIPENIPLDGSVLAFTIAVAVVVAVACGFAPALKISRPDLSRVLQAGGRRSSGGATRTRDTLVVAEIALSAALLAVAGLLIQSMLALQRVRRRLRQPERVHAAVPASGFEVHDT